MIRYTDATGLLGNAIALAALASKAPGISRLAPGARRAVAAAVLLVSLIPLGGLPLAGYLRGAIGDLSLTSLLLLVLCLARFTRGGARVPPPEDGRTALLALVAVTAVMFYPMALGWGGYDPYRLGYGSYGLLACLLAFALWGAIGGGAIGGGALGGGRLVAVAVALAVAGWSIGWYESANLWDYLMDPLVSVYALGALAWQGVRKVRGRARLQ